MPNFGLPRDWKQSLSYETFERVASRIVMFFISIIIVYSLILMAITLVDQFRLNPTYLDTDSLRDVFGSIHHPDLDRIQPLDRACHLVTRRHFASTPDNFDSDPSDCSKSDFARFHAGHVRTNAWHRRDHNWRSELLFWLINARAAGLPSPPSHE